MLSRRLGAEAIIDDGLLISRGSKVAGMSAKYEKTSMAAVKRAIFHHRQHAEQVIMALRKESFNALMVIGTSQRMVETIANRLELPLPIQWIRIEDVASPEEISSAVYSRRMEGKHVIPIPRLEVEKDWLSNWIFKVQTIFSHDKSQILGEQTIVFPRFQLGRIYIQENCVHSLIRLAARSVPGLVTVNNILVHSMDLTHITIHITVLNQHSPLQAAAALQQQVKEELERSLVDLANLPSVVVDRLHFPSRMQHN